MSAEPVAGPGPVERVLRLEGGTNFRDLGGYRTTGGGRVRRGVAFRSGTLHRLTDRDLAVVGRLGLRVVYDLRGDVECERAPSILPEGVRCERLPIGGTAARTRELTDLVAAGRLGEVPADYLALTYEAMAETAAATFGRLFTLMSAPGGLPALVHCTAGKDRTGVSAALLLSVLGVDDATIVDDYALSAVHYTEGQLVTLRRRRPDIDISDDRYRRVFGAPRHAMVSLLALLRDRHGSVEGYLRQEAGVAPEALAALRERLVEPAP